MILRSKRALVGQEQVLGQLLGERRAALHHAAGPRIFDQRPEQAEEIDAEMLEKPPVFGRQHRLDEISGRSSIGTEVVMDDAAMADLIAIAVEEGDGIIATDCASPCLVSSKAGSASASISTMPTVPHRHAFAEEFDRTASSREPEAAEKDGDRFPAVSGAGRTMSYIDEWIHELIASSRFLVLPCSGLSKGSCTLGVPCLERCHLT